MSRTIPAPQMEARRGNCGWRRDTLQLDLKHRFAFRLIPRRNFCERNRSNHYFNSEFISSAAEHLTNRGDSGFRSRQESGFRKASCVALNES
jgi:hypothetical protein